MATCVRTPIACTNDDYQRYTGAYGYSNATSMSFGYYCSANYKHYKALYRWKLNVPKNATICAARFEAYNRAGTQTTAVCVWIGVMKSDNAPRFCTNTAGDCTYWSTKCFYTCTKWAISAAWSNNTQYASVDFAAQVQCLVQRASWSCGNYMAIRVSKQNPNTGFQARQLASYDATLCSLHRPILVVRYAASAVSVCANAVVGQASSATTGYARLGADVGGVHNFVVASCVGCHDWHFRDEGGFSNTCSSLWTGKFESSKSYAAGFIFPLALRHESVIVHAKLRLWAAATRATAISVHAISKATDNETSYPTSYAQANCWFSSKAGCVTTTIPAITINQEFCTGNFNKVIQNVIDRTCWVSGNKVAFELHGYQAGVVSKRFFSRNYTCATRRPLLSINACYTLHDEPDIHVGNAYASGLGATIYPIIEYVEVGCATAMNTDLRVEIFTDQSQASDVGQATGCGSGVVVFGTKSPQWYPQRDYRSMSDTAHARVGLVCQGLGWGCWYIQVKVHGCAWSSCWVGGQTTSGYVDIGPYLCGCVVPGVKYDVNVKAGYGLVPDFSGVMTLENFRLYSACTAVGEAVADGCAAIFETGVSVDSTVGCALAEGATTDMIADFSDCVGVGQATAQGLGTVPNEFSLVCTGQATAMGAGATLTGLGNASLVVGCAVASGCAACASGMKVVGLHVNPSVPALAEGRHAIISGDTVSVSVSGSTATASGLTATVLNPQWHREAQSISCWKRDVEGRGCWKRDIPGSSAWKRDDYE